MCAFRPAVPSERYLIWETNLLYPFVSSFCTPSVICYSLLFFANFVSSVCISPFICYSLLSLPILSVPSVPLLSFATFPFLYQFCKFRLYSSFHLLLSPFLPAIRNEELNRESVGPAPYVAGPGFKSQFGCYLRVFRGITQPLRANQIRRQPCPSHHNRDPPRPYSTVHVAEGLEQVAVRYACGQLCVYRQGSPVETAEHERRQQDRPAACVVAQQYSSATCASLLFHYRTRKIRCAFQKSYFSLFNFIKTWQV